MGREVEVKIKLDHKEHTILKNWLKENAIFIGIEKHEEYYLNNPESSFLFQNINGYKDAETYFRVRFLKDNKAQVNLKKFSIDQENNKSENIGEYEFYSDNALNTLELLETLGFTDKTSVKKNREIYTYKNFEIVIDDVEGLGLFAEFELKDFDQAQDIKSLYSLIFQFIKSIGFTSIREQKRGYVSMLWNPDQVFTSIRDL